MTDDDSEERPQDPDRESSFDELAATRVGPASAPFVPRSQIGPYKLLQKIAEGGMGAVYMAEQEQPIRRRVALKVIKAGTDSEQIVARFEAERQALAMMDHPNIARIFDGGTTDEGSPFFAMELVQGIPFTEFCDNNNLSIRERLSLFVPVCNAVQHAHQKGIIHRDLKPSNVLVAVHDGVAVPKVIDFGLAKAVDLQTKLTDRTMFTEFGQIVGTLQYMSPEQAEVSQLDIDSRTDVYSLGVMLYELLTGSTPLDRETLRQNALLKILQIIRDSEPPRPSSRLSSSGTVIARLSKHRDIEPARLKSILSGELDWVVMKALEKDRNRRYESASGFASDVSRFLNDQTVEARPPSAIYRTRKFVKRHRTQLIAMSTVAIALLAAILLTPVFLKLNRDANTARHQAAVARVEQEFEVRLNSIDLTEESWVAATSLITQLRSHDEALAEAAQERLADSLAAATQSALRQPRLGRQDREQIGTAIDRLKREFMTVRNAERLDQLADELSRLDGGWSVVFANTAEAARDLQTLFDAADVGANDSGSISTRREMTPPADPLKSLPSDFFAPLTSTRQSCEGDIRVTASFDSWQSTHEVGVSLNAAGLLGYDFVLRAGGGDGPALDDERAVLPTADNAGLMSFADVRSSEGVFLLEIRRGTTSLIRQEMSCHDVPLGLLKLIATREGNVLTIQINDLPSAWIVDPFPFRRRDEGQVAVRMLPATKLLALKCESRTVDAGGSPLQEGDQLYSETRFSEALGQYQAQRAASADQSSEIVQESQFKAAMCLLQLQRKAEAEALLQELLQLPGDLWPALAGLTLWDEAVKQNRSRDADDIYTYLTSTGNLTRIASLATEETRNRIVRSSLDEFDSIAGLLKPNPNRLQRIQRAAAIDQALSYDGAGTIDTQILLARAYRFEGDFDKAAEILANLLRRSRNQLVVKHYSRVLRLSGRAKDALELIDGELKAPHADRVSLLYDRARAAIILRQYVAAEKDVNAAIRLHSELSHPGQGLRSSMLLMRGFLRHRRGDREGAADDWKTGYQDGRSHFVTSPSAANTELIHLLILGSLSNDLRREDVDTFVNRSLQQFGAGDFHQLVTGVVSPDTIFRCLNSMWRTPVGMEWAEAFAYENVRIRDRTYKPAVLAAYQMFSQDAFQGQPSPTESELLWQAAEEFFDMAFVNGTLSLPQVGQVGLAWKGNTGFLGWGSVRNQLPQPLRSRLAFILGHRFIARGDLHSATTLFEEAAGQAEAAPEESQLALQALKFVSAEKGALSVSWNGPDPVSVEIYDEAGHEVARLEVADVEVVEVPAGKYSFKLASGTAVAGESRNVVPVSIGRVTPVAFTWRYSPARHESTLPGLLSHPASLTGKGGWQIVRTEMEGYPKDLAWSPDGSLVAVVGADCVLRLTDIASRSTVKHFTVSASNLTSVDWSPDGQTLALGDMSGAVYFVDAATGNFSPAIRTFESRGIGIRRVRWSHDGSRLAVAPNASDVFVLRSNGEIMATLQGHETQVLRAEWSPDDSSLATVGTAKVIVWDLETNTPRHVINEAGECDVTWSNDSTHFAIATTSEFTLRDTLTGETVNSAPMTNRMRPVDIAWEPQGSRVFASGWDGGTIIWNTARQGDDAVSPSARHGYSCLRWHPHLPQFAIAKDNGFGICDDKMDLVVGINRWPKIGFTHSSLNPSSELLAAVMETGQLCLLDRGTGKTIASARMDYHCAAWHPQRDFLVAATHDGSLIVLSPKLEEVQVLKHEHGALMQLVWCPDGSRLLATTPEKILLRFDCVSGTDDAANQLTMESPSVLCRQNSDIGKVAISPDGQTVAVTHAKKQIDLISVDDGSPVKHLEAPDEVLSLSFSNDGSKLAAGTGWRTLVWGITENLSVKTHPIIGYLKGMSALGAKGFAIGNTHGDVYLLNPSGDDEAVNIIRRGSEAILSIQPTSSGTLLLTCAGGVIREIDPTDGRVTSAVVSASDRSLASFSGGGALLSPPATLAGFSCIIEDDGGQTSIPAEAFFRDLELQ